MRLGSLCSGYGALEAGIGQVLDIEPVWCSEIDKDASKVLATHHPDVPNLGDLTVLDWHQVEPVDIICGGFPCQPFSHAGKRQGADDDRAIFSYIADGISVLRPRLVVLENVAAITTLGGPAIIAALTQVGYHCRWGVVRASDAGAPHRRARWWCVAAPADASDRFRSRTVARPLWPESGNGAERFGVYQPAIQRWSGQIGRRAPDPLDGDGRLSPHFVEWMMGLDQGYICDVGLSRTAALRLLGNGVVPAQPALAVDLLL